MMREFSLVCKSKKLNVITFDMENPSAILIHLHGLGSNFQYDTYTDNDFKNRFNFFSKIKIKSYGLEFEGHGKSDGQSGYIDNFNNLIYNFETLYNYIKYTYNNLPIFVLAESMGCCVIIKSIIMKKFDLKGIVLLAPLLGISDSIRPSNTIINNIIRLSYLFPKSKIVGTKNMNEGCDNEKYNLLKTLNKYLYRGKFMLSTARECYINGEFVYNNCENIDIPIIAFHSTKDKVTCYKKTEQFINKIKSIDKELVLFEDGNHTLLVPLNDNDIKPFIILSKIINWINNKI